MICIKIPCCLRSNSCRGRIHTMANRVSPRNAKLMTLLWLLLLLNTVKISAARRRSQSQGTSTSSFSKISSDYNFGYASSTPTPRPSRTTTPLFTKQAELLGTTTSPSSSSSTVSEQTKQSGHNSSNTQIYLAESSSSGIIIELNTTADSYIRGGQYKDVNYGKASELFLKHSFQDSSSSALGRKAVVKFGLNTIDTSKVLHATLAIFFTLDETRGAMDDVNQQSLLQSNCIVQVARLTHNDWDEANVTWTNLNQELDQSVGYSYLNSTLAAVTNQWVEVDVTSLVSDTTSKISSDVVSLVLELISDDNYILSLSSRESGLVPRLILVMNKVDDDILSYTEKTHVVPLSNRTKTDAHSKAKISSSIQQQPTLVSSSGSDNQDTISTPLVFSAAAFSGVAFALLGLFIYRHVYYKNAKNTNGIKNQTLKPTPTTEVRAARGRLQQIHHGHFGGSASAISNDDDKTTSDQGSDESSIVEKKDSCSWFKTLTAFQNTGGSTLGGTIVL